MLELKEKILEIVNKSGLPLEAIMYVLKDLYRDALDNLERLAASEKEDNIETEEEA